MSSESKPPNEGSPELPPLAAGEVRVLPLGGLGQVGMNCLALEQKGGIVVIDCGTLFPHEDRGVDVMHPDFSWLLEQRDRVRGVFLTHGHEDHVGALPYLLRHLEVPVWGPPHALAMAARRVREHGLSGRFETRVATPRQQYEVGPFQIEPVRVAHSIVEASALAVTTAAGLVVHSGDFNFDPSPPDLEPSDEKRLRELGEAGVQLLLSDSTNIDTPGYGGSEKDVGEALEELVESAPSRVFIALFASNVQRLLLLGDIAQRCQRRICLLGRSLSNQVDIAHEIGRLNWPSDLVISPERVQSSAGDSVLLLVGGTQGEPRSALARLARDNHHLLKLEADDRVILSSRVIPGNELRVHEMVCDLLRIGVDLHTRHTNENVHTSGHATREEQRHLIELLRPKSFIPLHGTLHHLRRHAELAREVGVEDVVVVENGSSVRLQHGGLLPDREFRHGIISVAYGGESIDADALRRRGDLGRYGLALVSLAADEQLRLTGPIRLTTRGVPKLDDDPGAARLVEAEVGACLERLATWRKGGVDYEGELRRAVRRRIEDLTGARPVIEVHLVRSW